MKIKPRKPKIPPELESFLDALAELLVTDFLRRTGETKSQSRRKKARP